MQRQTIDKDRREAADKKKVEQQRPPCDLPDDWDRIDQESWESFPASDPPSHWAGKDDAPQP